jgi:hypothetical protein
MSTHEGWTRRVELIAVVVAVLVIVVAYAISRLSPS